MLVSNVGILLVGLIEIVGGITIYTVVEDNYQYLSVPIISIISTVVRRVSNRRRVVVESSCSCR